ncbi:MAG: SDR family oxidoreductase [Methanomethylophilus sp.]
MCCADVEVLMGETVLITGVTGGLGQALATEFAGHGYDLVLTGRSAGKLEELSMQLTAKYGCRCQTVAVDLTDPTAPQWLFDRTEKAGRPVDVLVNNAGFGDVSAFAASDLQKDRDMIAVNVSAVIALTRLFLPAMLTRGHGGILNIASMAAFEAMPEWAVYAASKAFVLSFTEALYEENRGRGLHFCALCPGPTATGFEHAAAGAAGSKLFTETADAAEVAVFAFRSFTEGKIIAVPGAKNRLEAMCAG